VCIADCLCNAVAQKGGEQALEYMKETEALFEKFTF